MGCRSCYSNPCACNIVPLPYYEDACYQENQSQGCQIYNQYSPVIRVSTAWAVPEGANIVTLKVAALADMMIGAVISNPEYGDYEVVSYDAEGQTIKVIKTAYNEVTVGTAIPACTKFIVVSSINADIAQIEQDIGVLQTEVDELQAEVIVIEADIVTIEADIVAIEADIVTIEADIVTIEADIVTIEADIVTIETAINQGWVGVSEAWTYASASTINVPTGAASRFQKGDKLKFTNSGTKYLYVIAVADTLLTVTGGSDYSVANAAISAIFLSRAERPFGFPAAFNWTPSPIPNGSMTYTGVAVLTSLFTISGTRVDYELVHSGTIGVVLNNIISHTLPVESLTVNLSGSVTINNSTIQSGIIVGVSTTSMGVRKADSSNYIAGVSSFCINASYYF